MFNNSKNQKALTAFKKQRGKLEDQSYYKDVMWVAKTADLIKKYIGVDSSLHKVAERFTFSVMTLNMDSKDIRHELNAKQEQAFKLVDNCIEFITNHGVNKEPKINFLQRMDNATVWTIVIAIITAFSSGGYFVGYFFTKLNSERELDRKEIQIETLTQQLKYSEALLDKLSIPQRDSISFPNPQIK